VAGRAVRYAAPRASAWISRGGSACAFNSFSAETPVATPDGPKPISEVALGDQVLAYHEPLAATGSYTVTGLISHQDQVITHLTIAGEQLETTPEHAFYTDERGWVPAQDLQVGMHVWRADGTMGRVQSVLQVQQPQRMYNLSVAEAHTFFVGDGEWLVHNCARPRLQLPSRAKGGTYVHVDPATGTVMRVGRTKDLAARQAAHNRDPRLQGLQFRIDARTNSYKLQRGREQILMNKYNPPLNKIRGISPNNPNRRLYMRAGRRVQGAY
jgi:hypothetical protein